MRFGSTAKVLLKCKLKYYRISECSTCHETCGPPDGPTSARQGVPPLPFPARPLQSANTGMIKVVCFATIMTPSCQCPRRCCLLRLVQRVGPTPTNKKAQHDTSRKLLYLPFSLRPRDASLWAMHFLESVHQWSCLRPRCMVLNDIHDL